MKKDANRRKQRPDGAEKMRAADASHRGNTEGEHGDQTATVWRVLSEGLPVALRVFVDALDEGKKTPSRRETGTTSGAESALVRHIKRVKKALDGILPGCLKITKDKNLDDSSVDVRVLGRNELVEAYCGIVTHNLKFADPACRDHIPLDKYRNPSLVALCGMHGITGGGFDYSGNATYQPGARRLMAVLENDGTFPLPQNVNLPPDLAREIAATERFAAEQLAGGNAIGQELAVSACQPQVLIPDMSVDGGYLSVTPVAAPAVLAEMVRIQQQSGSRLRWAKWMAAGGNKQNMTSVMKGKVLFAPPPVWDVEISRAKLLSLDASRWARKEINRLVRTDPDARKNMATFAGGVAKTRLASSTNSKQRKAEKENLEALILRLADRMVGCVSLYGHMFAGTPWDPNAFDVTAAARAIRNALASKVESVNPKTLNRWLSNTSLPPHRRLRSWSSSRRRYAARLPPHRRLRSRQRAGRTLGRLFAAA